MVALSAAFSLQVSKLCTVQACSPGEHVESHLLHLVHMKMALTFSPKYDHNPSLALYLRDTVAILDKNWTHLTINFYGIKKSFKPPA